jgi:prepilin-type N-terminal cleavage/methylation domain-containing protein
MSSKSWQRCAGGQRGFTLLELIVVCALIGTMLSLSIPSLRMAFFTDPLKSSARKVIGLVNGVRELAVRHQRPYLLHIDEIDKRIWFEMDRDIDNQGNKTQTSKNQPLKKKAIDNQLSDSQDKKTLREKEIRMPETVKIDGVMLAGEDSSEEQTVIWVTKQGYMKQTLVRLEDDGGKGITIRFFPFLDGVAITE